MKNNNKHIWEGWRVIDFINDLKPMFDMIMRKQSWQEPFTTKQQVKDWCMSNQPGYKKHIPEVVSYFSTKYNIK
jgi:hypothetical protein